MRLAVLGLAAMTVLSSAASGAQGWGLYANPRFGLAVDLPAGWRADPEPANGDGRRVVSPDGQASITVSGSYPMDAGPDEDFALRDKPETGETITYRLRRGTLLVVSGTQSGPKGKRIFYRKSLLSCGGRVWFDLAIEYPAGQRAALDSVVSHVAGTLRPGRGGSCGG